MSLHKDTRGGTGTAPAEGRSFLDRRRGAVTLSVLLPAAVLLLAAVFPMIRFIMSVSIPVCLMNYIGLRCPLCGGTRCTAALVQGDIRTAFYYNPLVVLMYLSLFIIYLRLVFSCFTKPYRRLRLEPRPVHYYILAALVVSFFIIRNLPFYRAVFF